jgi:hypothetical protein
MRGGRSWRMLRVPPASLGDASAASGVAVTPSCILTRGEKRGRKGFAGARTAPLREAHFFPLRPHSFDGGEYKRGWLHVITNRQDGLQINPEGLVTGRRERVWRRRFATRFRSHDDRHFHFLAMRANLWSAMEDAITGARRPNTECGVLPLSSGSHILRRMNNAASLAKLIVQWVRGLFPRHPSCILPRGKERGRKERRGIHIRLKRRGRRRRESAREKSRRMNTQCGAGRETVYLGLESNEANVSAGNI